MAHSNSCIRRNARPRTASTSATLLEWSLVWCVAIAVQIALDAAPAMGKPLKDRFQSLEFQSDASLNGRVYHYRLYVPESRGAPSRQPLLLWLQGNAAPQEKFANLRWLYLIFDATDDSPPFYILAPQRPEDEIWFTTQQAGADNLTAAYKMLEQVVAKYAVDPDRIYLCGVSAGGSACWELACRHPDRFAAVAPLAAAGGDISFAASLVKVPIWAFHARFDKIVPIDYDRRMVAAVSAAGGVAELTETEPKGGVAGDHNCWIAAFEEFKLLDWLLEQRRNAPESSPPGASAGAVLTSSVAQCAEGLKNFAWITVPWLGAALVIRIVWLSERQRRRVNSEVEFKLRR